MALLAGLVNSIPAKAVSANPNTVCAGSTCTVSFPYTGDFYQWTVPSTGTYTLEVWGAQGGHAGYNGTNYQSGAAGGYSTGTLSLTSGQTIYIYVGGQGAGLNDTTTLTRVAGGWNGGGQGYSGNLTNNNRAGGGGGATDIRTVGQALSNRVIVAGGGGGGTYFSTYGTNTSGVGGG